MGFFEVQEDPEGSESFDQMILVWNKGSSRLDRVILCLSGAQSVCKIV